MSAPVDMEAPRYLLNLTEKQWQALVVEAAKHYGWFVHHERNSLANPSGLPDLQLWRNQEYRLIELKTTKGKLRESQRRFIAEAGVCGVLVSVFTPDDWDALLEVLR
jgi:VRR-NUC domain